MAKLGPGADLPAAENVGTAPGAPALPAAGPAEPGLLCRPGPPPDGAGTFSTWSQSWTGLAARCRLGGLDPMDGECCLKALKEAPARHGRPEIFAAAPSAVCRPPVLRTSDPWAAAHGWQAVHLVQVHQRAEGSRPPGGHGRTRTLARRRVHRTALAGRTPDAAYGARDIERSAA